MLLRLEDGVNKTALLVLAVLAGCKEAPTPSVDCTGPDGPVLSGEAVEFTVAVTEGGDDPSIEWALSDFPDGSTANLLDSDESTSTLLADVPGNYIVVVTVDVDGQTASCETSAEVIDDVDTDTDTDLDTDTDTELDTEGLADGLRVELSWLLDGDDLDIHLLRADGEIRTDGDCYYSNCVAGGTPLDWGVEGDTTDNPSLLGDSQSVGPEVIEIEAPEDLNYTVVVHDYAGQAPDMDVLNSVTVTVWMDGVEVYTDTRRVSGEGSEDPFVMFNPIQGTATPL